MNDLIARANKYARSSGRTGQGQYRAAEKDERLGRILSWTSTTLTAIVGTSIFTQWVQNYPIPLGLAAIIAAALTAVHTTSKLEQRAEVHRNAGAEYGRLRRRADMLRLRLHGGDLSRAEGLAELDQIGEGLSEQAGKTRALPDQIYKPASDAFDAAHPEYADIAPAPAGTPATTPSHATV